MTGGEEIRIRVTNLRTGKEWTDTVEVRDGKVVWLGTELQDPTPESHFTVPPRKGRRPFGPGSLSP